MMVIQSPFFNKMNFDEILKLVYEYGSFHQAQEKPRKIMSSEELEIYKQKYEEFRKKYILKPSSGLAGMMLKSNEQLVTPYKLYIDPGVNTFDFAELIINRCKKRNLDYTLKFITPEEVKDGRAEKLIVYGTDSKNISEFYYIIKEIMKENASMDFIRPPIYTDNLNDNIGLGFDLTGRKLRPIGNTMVSDISFNSWISVIMNGCAYYIRTKLGKVNIKNSLKDYPEIREKVREYFNKEYIKVFKEKFSGIEQFIILEEWYLNDNKEYRLKTFQNGSIKEYTSEEAIKLFGLIPPNFEWVLNQYGEYQLRVILIDKNGNISKRGYSLDQAIKKFGLTPPDYKYYKDDQKLPIERNVKK